MSMPFTWEGSRDGNYIILHHIDMRCSCNCFPLYLQDHVPRQQASIPSNDTFSVDVLDENANQWGLIASNNADGQRFWGFHPRDLNTGNFTIRDQVMELRKSQHYRRRLRVRKRLSFILPYCMMTRKNKLRHRQTKQERKWEKESVDNESGGRVWWTVVERFSSGTSCLYSPQVTKTNLYKPRGKIYLADYPE